MLCAADVFDLILPMTTYQMSHTQSYSRVGSATRYMASCNGNDVCGSTLYEY